MTLISKVLASVGLQRKSDSVVKWTDERGMDGNVGAAGEHVSAHSSLGHSAVWGCANLISGTLSSLPFEVVRQTEDGIAEVASTHPLHQVIYESPNYDQTALDFWDFMNLSLELWGNAYASVKRRGDKVVALYPVNPDLMSVRRREDGRLEYRWTDDGKPFNGLDRDVFHVRGPGGSPLGGMSTLRYGMQAFSSALAADRTAAGMFRNGLRPSALIKFKEWLTPEQRATTERLVEKYVGAANSGKPFIAEGGMEYDQVSISPEDAQLLETRLYSVEEICRFFQVPPVLIGHAGASTAWPTSVDQQVLMFTKFYLRRRVKRIEQAVRKQLLTPSDRAAGISARINMDGLLRGDSESRASFYQTMIQIGGMTINEVRKLEGRKPVEGGDVVRMQMQNIPLSETGES
ncbi:phage portal protein [Phaeobacter inhibens]|uniref:phage portal protein n=1 Tax=Phaeobacter inhibens TaxID=221822 RepID=UPI000163305E|nr:phage portal protein [Phaeobacter inhibens]AFO91929.1 phage portal protein [Phaeobacter inhibens DSM 17395]AUQ46600.1 phage portal protein [Phaeobacter inhibens]AXT23291.1 phage portal protein [Phaeobacter inhibens]MDO6755386.1 phage portal protein [Phaeobacter inhibens]